MIDILSIYTAITSFLAPIYTAVKPYIWPLIFSLLLALLVYLILRKWLKDREELEVPSDGEALGDGDSVGGSGANSGWLAENERLQEEQRRLEEAKRQQRENLKRQRIQTINNNGGLLATLLEGMPNPSDETVEVLELAGTQDEIRFDLKSESRSDSVNYPTANMDYTQIKDVSQLSQVSPAEMMLDDEQFYYKLVNDDLLCPEYHRNPLYAGRVGDVFKRFYILSDISGSMEFTMRMPNGERGRREIWARALIIGLLADAVEGRAEYLFRWFTDRPLDLRSVRNKKEALIFLPSLLTKEAEGGTNIGAAVSVAIKDIQERQESDFRMSHILLITDGEDQEGLTREGLEKTLGPDIKLHVVLIGNKYGPDHPLAPYIIKNY